jgi:hypothetical protein
MSWRSFLSRLVSGQAPALEAAGTSSAVLEAVPPTESQSLARQARATLSAITNVGDVVDLDEEAREIITRYQSGDTLQDMMAPDSGLFEKLRRRR